MNKIIAIILITTSVLIILSCIPILPNIETHKNLKYINKFTSRQILQLLEERQPVSFKPTNKNKIITFEWDCSGFNNVRMNFEIVCGLSIIHDRTIVLPPKHIWDHLPKVKVDLSDFYSIDNLREYFSILTHSEYTGKDQSYVEFIDEMNSKNGLQHDLLVKMPQKYKELEKEKRQTYLALSCM